MNALQQGPLAPVWMAANYEKKLTKHQLLNTNIVTSTNYLSQPISTENVTLRLSGQLLLGIVRIYSRKTKYLLDDVNDILFKLKNAFKFASGGVLLASENTTTNASSRSVITNLNSITLQDQVTGIDLLYQDDFNLDDEPFPLLRASLSSQPEDFDRSVEIGRLQYDDDDQMIQDDMDFDLDLDNSIEVGRDVSVANPDISTFDIGGEKFGLDIDEPLETVPDDGDVESPVEPTTPPEIAPEPAQPRKKLVGITEDGRLKTNKRRIQVDSETEVNSGITIEELRHLRFLQLNGDWRDEVVSFRLTESEKLQLIKDLAEPTVFKKRKIIDVDSELARLSTEVSDKEKEKEQQEEDQFQGSFDDFNFDLSLPDFNEEPEEPLVDDQIFFSQDSDTTSSTKQISEILKSHDRGVPIAFNSILDEDTSTNTPLGAVKRGDSTMINMKREATKCFFEMLVLGTRDCISIDQQPGNSNTDIGGDISITTKDNLFN